jgi:hypothetical protein
MVKVWASIMRDKGEPIRLHAVRHNHGSLTIEGASKRNQSSPHTIRRDANIAQAERAYQKAVDSVGHMRVEDRIDRRLEDGDGDVLMSGADGSAEEDEHSLRAVLLLGPIADGEAMRNQRLRIHRFVCHGCKGVCVLRCHGKGELLVWRGRQ